jgi:hypothetical protein
VIDLVALDREPALDLGKPLVLDFAREFLPDDYDEVRHIFSRRGAYRWCDGAPLKVERFLESRGDGFAGGARRTGLNSARPGVTLLPSTLGLDEGAEYAQEPVQLLAQS